MLRKSSNVCMNTGNFSTQSRAHITQQSRDQNEEKQGKNNNNKRAMNWFRCAKCLTRLLFVSGESENWVSQFLFFFSFFFKYVCSAFVFVTVVTFARAPPNLTKSMFSSFSLSPFCPSFAPLLMFLFFSLLYIQLILSCWYIRMSLENKTVAFPIYFGCLIGCLGWFFFFLFCKSFISSFIFTRQKPISFDGNEKLE